MNLRDLTTTWSRDLDAIVHQLDEVVGGSATRATGAPSAEVLRRNESAIATFARSFTFALRIPGNNRGATNSEVFEFLRRGGRDFGAMTRSLRDHVRYALIAEFSDYPRVVSAVQLKQTASSAILEWVVARLEGRKRDIRIPVLTPKYAIAKRRAGYGGRPVGVRTGKLLGALRDATVTVKI